ncbi:VCBS domain-containing protein [Falsiroseomonas ponticola]|uniref:VCBS domain-containing protein n=1 Tax=Falsiroseomonas ponticola TaxID=2786951 RepID=UPI00193360BC|nr:VCBS domain-containing protein [Roseomonas ponticola]
MAASFQAELARFLAHAATTPWADFRFAAQSLTVRGFEAAAVTVDGVALTAADDAVVAVADRFTVSEDAASVAGNVTANDSVADLVAAVRLVTAASGGSLVLGADGAFSWTGGDAFQSLRAGQSAEVTFSYRVTDADGDAGVAVATITILGANDAATIGGETEGRIRAGAAEKVGGRLSIADLDAGEAVFGDAKGLEGRFGHFDFDAKTGAWTYVLDTPAEKLREIAGGEALVETLVVVSADGATTQEVTVTIEAAREKGANLLVNGSFEEPAIKDGAWSPVKEMPGWTSNAGAIEVWAGYGGMKASDGRQHIEIDYDRAVDAISQKVDAEAGARYVLTFDARARTDKPATEGFVVMWNEEKLAFIQPTTKEWTRYEFIVEGREGMDLLAFVEDAAGNDSYGGLLDNVALRDAVW